MKKNVETLVALLKKPEEEITKALETDGGLETIVSDFKTNNQVFNITDFAKLKTNIKEETIAHLEEGDIPDSFKNKAVGWKLEKLENEIKEKYQFTDEHKGLTDLVDKIVTKTKPQKENDGDLVALKKKIVELEDDYKDKLNTKQNEFDTSIIRSDFDKAIKALGLDYEGEEIGRAHV